ncbi:MAG: hypothetical protein GTN75_15590 [Gemmatimonadetes bacterium]|nr:hypothetical protein [Gemmatimonadota bacterium]
MALFEYLGVLISVVMGLGITHLLIGTSKLIQQRDSIRAYWVHTLWTVNILVYVLAIWWGMFWWSRLAEWTFYQFLFVTLYAVALFLLAAMLYPWDFPTDFDFKGYFYKNRSWFFGIQFVAWCIDVPETVLKEGTGLRELPQLYFFFVATMLGLSLVGAITNNRRYHEFYAPFWLVFLLGYLGLTTLARIAA